MPDVLLLLLTALIALIFSYLVVTVFNVGGKPDEALNRDLEQLFMQIGVQMSVAIFLPLKGGWEIGTDLVARVFGNIKWLVAFALFTAAVVLMHFYHYEVLSIIDDGWTCTVIPLMKNIITPMLQITRVLFAIATPVANAFIIIHAQIVKAWLSTFAACSHINLFKIVTEMSKAVISSTGALSDWFGVGSESEVGDDNNFYKNDFNISRPVNHTLTAISIGQEVLACACKRFEPLFNILFFVVEEPHVTEAINNGFQTLVRIFQLVFRLLFLDFPDVYRITFKLERAVMESGLALDSIMFNVLQNIIKMITPEFSLTKKPEEAIFTMGAELASAAIHTAATIGINGPLHVFSTNSTRMSAFDPEIWSLDRSFSYIHRSIYSGAVLVQWVIYIMERLVTDTVNVMDVFTDENTPLELSCDWARDVRDHKYVSIGYTAACSMYNMGISSVNVAAITYGLGIELLTKSIFTQEQNVFRTLQRWEGPHLPRNRVYTCEEREKITAYNFETDTYYKEGWVWTQDRSKCGCERAYGTTLDEFDKYKNKLPYYNPWCGQPSLNFDVFAPLDALVMHVSHGILGPGFGDAFPFITPIRNIEINIQFGGGHSIEKSIALPFALPPLTRTAIESVRVLTRVVLAFGDIVTGNFFNYPVNCGHGMNRVQLLAKYGSENKAVQASGTLHDEQLRWSSCKKKAYKAMSPDGKKRTTICDKNNNSPGCMCSYLQPLSVQSKCLCIARYPDLDVTSSSQQVGDLIEKRFTSEDVSIHWCNSMIIEWTFQNTAAFADALDYMVSLGPINPTCDVMDRLVADGVSAIGEKVGERDERATSAYLIANTPTLEFTGEFMSASSKMNHIKDLNSETRTGCVIEPGEEVDATNEFGDIIYEQDEFGNDIEDRPVKIMTSSSWSCEASDNYVSIASLNKLTTDKDEDKPGCRIWGRTDFFCSAGLYVRNSKRLSMNIARQLVNDGISIIAGNFADVNLGTLPRLCDYERQQGAIAAMVAGIIPRISLEMKKAFAKYINMLLQLVFVHTLRTTLVLVNMVTTIVQNIVADPTSVSADSIEGTFKSGINTMVSGYLWAIRYFFQTTGELLDAISPGAGDICDSIVDIIDMISKQLKQGLMDLVALALKVIFNLIAALTGDTSAIGPFFENAFKLWTEMALLIIKKMWDILDKIYDFFGPIGDFMKILTYGVCMAINGIMWAIDEAISALTFGMGGLDWEEMKCVTPKLRGEHGNHTSGPLGKHFLRSIDNDHLPRRVADTLDWSGSSVCDHFMTGVSDYAYTDLRPLEKARWLECLEYKLIGIEIAKFVESDKFPTDLVYNWKRKYILLYEFATAMKIIVGQYTAVGITDWANVRMLLYDAGLDADLYIRLCQKFMSTAGQVIHTVGFTNFAEFVFENVDPDYKNSDNPSTTATAWKSLTNAKEMYTNTQSVWIEKDMSKQLWTAIDASYEAHAHLQNWWSTIGTDIPAEQTHTEQVFSNFKLNLQSFWKERVHTTNKHSKTPILKTPVKTGIQSCGERGSPGWCTDCAIMDNLIETVIEQGEAIAIFYSGRFPKILNNVSGYFEEIAEYNSDFFEDIFDPLTSEHDIEIPKTKIRWTYHVSRDWTDFFSSFGQYITNGSFVNKTVITETTVNGTIVTRVSVNVTNKDLWLGQIDKFLDASRHFLQSTDDEYIPFFGYGFKHMYEFILFSKCDMEQSIYVTTTTEEQRLEYMDTALITCAIIILFIITNTTWSVIPLVWLANTVIIGFIVKYLYLYMVYGYFLNCSPVIPLTLVEDINSWYHTRMDPGCFYKALPYIAINATDDTCLSCASPQKYINCANYTIVNYEDGMLPLSELMEDYSIAWPFLFWIRWKLPEIAIFAVKNGLITYKSVLGRLAMGAWQEEPIDPIWIDCYNAMWLDNVLVGIFALLAAWITTKMMMIIFQTLIQLVILILYIYTTLSYMSLAVEKSVVVN
jgi:hypothetical protein